MAAVNWQQQRALLKLRGRLTLRQFMREPGKFIGVITVVAIFVPVFLALAGGVAIAYYQAPAPWPGFTLAIAILGTWGAWLLFPIFFNSLSDNFDMSRLVVYPISRRDLLLSSVLGSVFDYPMYFMLPLTVAVLLSWGIGAQIVIVMPALIISYGIMLLSSQLVTLVLGAILQSRRFRDAMILFFSLVGLSCAFLNLGIEYLTENIDFTQVDNVVSLDNVLGIIQWLPPGAIVQSIRLAEMGDWLPAGSWLLYATIWLAAMGYLWFVLVQRLIVGSGFLIQLGQQPEEFNRGAETSTTRFSWIPAEIKAFAAKELKTVWRTPSRRITIFQGLLLPIIMFVPMLTRQEAVRDIPDWFGLAILGITAFNQWTITLNMVGFEGRGLPTLMLLPFSRQHYFIGKSFGLSLVSLPSVLLISVAILLIAPHWIAAASIVLIPAVALPVTSLSVITSALFPTPVNLEKGTKNPSMTRGGCLAGLVQGLMSPLLNALLVSPIIVPMIIAYRLDWWWLPLLITIPVYIYGLLVFRFATRWAGERMTAQTPEIVAKAALPEDR